MDENLQSVGDLVSEALSQGGDSGIKEGVQTQQQLDVENAQVETPKEPVAPVIPVLQDGVKSTEAPTNTPAPQVGVAGDKIVSPAAAPVEPETPVVPVIDPAMQTKLDEYETMKTRNTELETLNQDYAGKLKQKIDPWANQEIAELNQFVKETGLNDSGLFNKLKGADLQNMESKNVLEIQMQKDNPNLTQGEIKGYIERKYNQSSKNFDHIIDDDERRISEEAYKHNQDQSATDMKIDANKARTELIGLQDKIKPVDLGADLENRQREHKESVDKMTNDWSPHIAKAVDELRQFPIEVPGADGVNKKLASFEVPADKLTVYRQQAMQFAINNGIEASNLEGQKAVNQFMANLVMIEHKDQIIQKTVNATRADMELEVEKEISNPTGDKLPITPGQGASGERQPKTAGDHEEEAFNAAEKQIMDGDYL
jgi:hypothetical protein